MFHLNGSPSMRLIQDATKEDEIHFEFLWEVNPAPPDEALTASLTRRRWFVKKMNKIDEQKIAEMVFGRNTALKISAWESPDFLLRREEVVILGIEVTEYFDNESEARLQKLPEYTAQLLGSKTYRHKDDKEHLKVQRVKYIPKADPAKAIELDAIAIAVPSLGFRLNRLAEAIRQKSTRWPDYLASAPQIDLLVYDGQDAFNFTDFAKIYRPLSVSPVRQAAVASEFREVFLITCAEKQQPVCIPLKANAF